MSDITVIEGGTESSGGFKGMMKKIENTVTNLINLEIKTIVGEFDVYGFDDVRPKPGEKFNVMMSQINLIEGDITTHISSELLYEKYEWLRQYHAEKEARGNEIIQGNIKAVMSLIELIQKSSEKEKEK
jgi:hypothetical protein